MLEDDVLAGKEEGLAYRQIRLWKLWWAFSAAEQKRRRDQGVAATTTKSPWKANASGDSDESAEVKVERTRRGHHGFPKQFQRLVPNCSV